MKKYLYFFFLCFSISTEFVQAQIVQVRDQVTLQALQGVAISFADAESAARTSVATDADGKADLSNFGRSGLILFERIGYQSLQISINGLAALQYKVALSEKTYSLDEVVISASKFEEKRSDVPQQIQVLDAKKLAFMNQQNTADVLQQSGNVLVQKSQQGGGSPIIRGFEANKVLIVVDGVRMNNAIYRGGHLQNVLTLDNTVLDRMEVVFGPGSVVYGSDALGGVMHFYTRDPLLSDTLGAVRIKGQAFARYSTANFEKTGHMDLNFGWQKIGLFSSLTVSDFGDLRQGSHRNAAIGELGARNF
ncbi:MAG TPA: TonB-dependent receptor plug domain-containing protein, partial [Flavobacterium sp.]|nr:TonB-dependent receptor plug domain-containing protein [Flavobacterium sp.]